MRYIIFIFIIFLNFNLFPKDRIYMQDNKIFAVWYTKAEVNKLNINYISETKQDGNTYYLVKDFRFKDGYNYLLLNKNDVDKIFEKIQKCEKKPSNIKIKVSNKCKTKVNSKVKCKTKTKIKIVYKEKSKLLEYALIFSTTILAASTIYFYIE